MELYSLVSFIPSTWCVLSVLVLWNVMWFSDQVVSSLCPPSVILCLVAVHAWMLSVSHGLLCMWEDCTYVHSYHHAT